MSHSPSLPDRPRLELDPEMSDAERLEADIDQTTEHELGESEKDLALETIRHLQERESQ